MGVTITANGSQESFDMGYIGFGNLRKNIAYCIDPELGNLYESILHHEIITDAMEIQINSVIAEKKLDCVGALGFLFQSDCYGRVDYRACREIYEAIKNVDFGDKCFQYGAIAHNDYERFKVFLKECVRYHRNMRWS